MCRSTGSDGGNAPEVNAPDARGLQVGTGNTQINNFGGDARRGVRRPWMAPQRSGPVVPRPELTAQLLAALIADDDRAVGVTTAVEGAGGFGKTTLASEVTRSPEVDARFPGGLLWVTVGEAAAGADLAGLVGGLAAVLSGQHITESDPMIAGGLLGSLLDERDPMLLVVDDVWRPEQLAPFLVGGRTCRRLVTTRTVGVVPAGGRRVLVDEMSTDEALRTLAANLPSDDVAMAGLLRWTGRWPVLLGLVNAALVELVNEGASVGEAVAWAVQELSATGPVAFDDPDAVHDPASRSHAVAATMEASIGLLTEAQRGHYLDLAVFPEDADVPLDVLTLLWAGSGLAGARVERFRRRLVHLRLAVGRFVTGQPALRLHDVLRSYLLVTLGPASVADANHRLLATARGLLPAAGTGVVRAADDPVPLTPWWELPGSVAGDYLRRNLAYHLTAAGLTDEAAATVCDLRWIESAISRFGYPVGIEADLARVGTPTAAALRRAVGQAAHLLTPLSPGASLAATLASRLADVPGLGRIVAEYRSGFSGVRFEPHGPMPDLPHPAHLRTLTGHTGGITMVMVSTGGGLLASVSDDTTVRLWDVATGASRTLRGHTDIVAAAALSPDETLLATGSYDRTVRLWDVVTGTAQALAGHTDIVGALAFSPDGALLATGSDDTTARLWDVTTGVSRVLGGHDGAVSAVAFSPDGVQVATASTDGAVSLWDVVDGRRRILPGHTGVISAITFSGDATLLATASHDSTVRVWEVRANARHASADLPVRVLAGHTDLVNAVAFSPDGRLLATGSGPHDRSVRLWDVAIGTSRVLTGHTGAVNTARFSRDGMLLASASDDGTVRLWNVRTGEGHALTAQADRVNAIALSSDSRLLAAGSSDGTVHVWDIPTGVRHAHTARTDRITAVASPQTATCWPPPPATAPST